MAFTPMSDVLNVHQSRATVPTETDSQLKLLFDTDVNTVKTRHNELVAELNATTDGASGADKLGMTPIAGLVATTPQGALEELSTGNVKTTGAQTIADVKTFTSSPIVPETPTTALQVASKGYVDTAITDVAVGVLPEGSVTDDYLSNATGQIKDRVDGKASLVTGTGTITTTGWGASATDYNLELALSVSGILSTDLVDIIIDIDDLDVASDSELAATNESGTDAITFYANTTPASTIDFTYRVVR